MDILDQTISWFDVIWFWGGRISVGIFLFVLLIAVLATMTDYCFRKINNIVLFQEFLSWRKNPVSFKTVSKDRDKLRKSLECNEGLLQDLLATIHLYEYAHKVTILDWSDSKTAKYSGIIYNINKTLDRE